MNKLKEGIFGVYKPKGISSFGIIAKLRKLTGIKKIGHAGTLDPLAKGVLVIAIGREATKKLSKEVEAEKEYIAEIKLGIESSTDDEEGIKTEIKFSKKPLLGDIKKILPEFIGIIEQIPPVYSALKIKGQPAYKLARKGKAPKMKPRKVEIKEIKLLKYKWPVLKIKTITGKGVYIRALARDIGRKLATGGYLTDLERTRVGDFSVKKCVNVI